jgi:uncharacterized protein (TIGR03435 family)
MKNLSLCLIALGVFLGSPGFLPPALQAQSPAARPSIPVPPKLEFDVASVKQNKSEGPAYSNLSLDSGNIYSTVRDGDVFSPTGGYFVATNQPIWRYIVFAYKLSGTQELALRFGFFAGLSSKAPAWVTGGFDSAADHFDIEARAEGKPTKDEMRLMMQSLLADRFKLVMHHEMRRAPIFALVLAQPGKIGPNLQAHPAEDLCAPASDAPLGSPEPDESSHSSAHSSAVGELPIVCGIIAHVPSSAPSAAPGQVRYGGRNITLELLANSLPTMTGLALLPRPVVDATGLTGGFDFTLGGWTSLAAEETGEAGPTFSEVLKQQLGLKLVPQSGLVDLLIIDHIEHPSDN